MRSLAKPYLKTLWQNWTLGQQTEFGVGLAARSKESSGVWLGTAPVLLWALCQLCMLTETREIKFPHPRRAGQPRVRTLSQRT